MFIGFLFSHYHHLYENYCFLLLRRFISPGGFNKENACRWFFFVMGPGSAPEQVETQIRFAPWRCLRYWTFFPLFSKLLWPEHQSQYVSSARPGLCSPPPESPGKWVLSRTPVAHAWLTAPLWQVAPWLVSWSRWAWHLTAVRSSGPTLLDTVAQWCSALWVCVRVFQGTPACVLLDTHPESVWPGWIHPGSGIFFGDCLFYWCWAVWVHPVFWIVSSHWIDHV